MNEQPTHNRSDDKPKVAATEAQYLQNQVAEASAAMSKAFAALKSDLAAGVDPRGWAQEHPWVAIGAAAVAGFAAASAVIPSKEAQALKKLSRIERALNVPPPEQPAGTATPDGHPDASHSKSFAGQVFSHVFSAIRPALSSALAAYAASSGQSSHNTNGHTAASAAASSAAYHQQEESDFDQA